MPLSAQNAKIAERKSSSGQMGLHIPGIPGTPLRCNPVILFCLLLLFTTLSPVSAQPLHIPLNTPEMDKAFSEFNHHLAGWFLLAVGICALLARSSPRLAVLGRIWPLLFILSGLYLAFMSDPDVWPMGEQTWLQAFRNNAEAAQHKVYAALLLAIGIIEFQRSRGKLSGFLAAWAFPILALFGAILLFFHTHHGEHMSGSMTGMHQGDHIMMESMGKIKREHLWFSIAGFGVILFKFMADAGYGKNFRASFLWPICISALGILLILYRE